MALFQPQTGMDTGALNQILPLLTGFHLTINRKSSVIVIALVPASSRMSLLGSLWGTGGNAVMFKVPRLSSQNLKYRELW
jgi:hypothetical protein